MPRILTGDDGRYNAWGQDTWTHPGEDHDRRLEREDRAAEWAGRPETHCGICGKPLEAQLTCVACGDETDREAA